MAKCDRRGLHHPSIHPSRSRLASARVAWTRWWTRSPLREWSLRGWTKLSMGALSRQLPLRLIDGVIFAPARASRWGSRACWTPRSERRINPGAGRWRRIALSSASSAIQAVRAVPRIDQPTILRVCEARGSPRGTANPPSCARGSGLPARPGWGVPPRSSGRAGSARRDAHAGCRWCALAAGRAASPRRPARGYPGGPRGGARPGGPALARRRGLAGRHGRRRSQAVGQADVLEQRPAGLAPRAPGPRPPSVAPAHRHLQDPAHHPNGPDVPVLLDEPEPHRVAASLR